MKPDKLVSRPSLSETTCRERDGHILHKVLVAEPASREPGPSPPAMISCFKQSKPGFGGCEEFVKCTELQSADGQPFSDLGTTAQQAARLSQRSASMVYA